MGLIYGSSKKRKKPTAKQLRDLEEAKLAAKALNAKWDKVPKFSDKNRGKVVPVKKEGPPALTTPPGRTTTHGIPSKVTKGGSAAQQEKKVYTGTAMKGVATMHKSNMVPVFTDEHMVDIANMRRNDYTKSQEDTQKAEEPKKLKRPKK